MLYFFLGLNYHLTTLSRNQHQVLYQILVKKSQNDICSHIELNFPVSKKECWYQHSNRLFSSYITRFNLSIVKLSNKVIKMKNMLPLQQMQIISGHIKWTIKTMWMNTSSMIVKPVFASTAKNIYCFILKGFKKNTQETK